jgi:hypothetical protein
MDTSWGSPPNHSFDSRSRSWGCCWYPTYRPRRRSANRSRSVCRIGNNFRRKMQRDWTIDRPELATTRRGRNWLLGWPRDYRLHRRNNPRKVNSIGWPCCSRRTNRRGPVVPRHRETNRKGHRSCWMNLVRSTNKRAVHLGSRIVPGRSARCRRRPSRGMPRRARPICSVSMHMRVPTKASSQSASFGSSAKSRCGVRVPTR